jgi:hypothetical protein
MITFSITVLGGILIFLIGQYIVRFIIEPTIELKKTFSELSTDILYNLGEISNASSDKDISLKLRKKSAEIVSKSEGILFYRFAQIFFHLPAKKNILKAARELNRVSAYMRQEIKDQHNNFKDQVRSIDFPSENVIAVALISDLLKLKTDYQ